METINGMIVVFSALWFALVICTTIHHFVCKTNDRDEAFNKICIRATQLKGQGVSIDEVMKGLSNEDLTGFHLSCYEK